jgi:hypothetical protein
VQRIYGRTYKISPVVACSFIVCVFVDLYTVETKNPSLNVTFRDEARDLFRVVRDQGSLRVLQCVIELRYPLPNSVGIGIDQDNESRFRLTTAAGFDLNGKSLSNPLLGAPFTRWRLDDTHRVCPIPQPEIPVYESLMEVIFYKQDELRRLGH